MQLRISEKREERVICIISEIPNTTQIIIHSMRNDGFNLESFIIDELQEPMAWNYFAALPILEIN